MTFETCCSHTDICCRSQRSGSTVKKISRCSSHSPHCFEPRRSWLYLYWRFLRLQLRSQAAVVQLQAGDKEMIDKWKDICEVSQFPFRLGSFFFFLEKSWARDYKFQAGFTPDRNSGDLVSIPRFLLEKMPLREFCCEAAFLDNLLCFGESPFFVRCLNFHHKTAFERR
jgi:hypothetical protein